MSGSMYDLSVTTFSPEGRIYQVEYATKAVENSETVIGIQCKDGIVLAAEKQVFSKLLVENSNRRVYNIEDSIGMVLCGKLPDGRNILQRARAEASSYLKTYALPISGQILAERVAIYMHQYTIHGQYRPFGAAVFISSYDPFDGYNLYMIEPSGHVYAYYGYAHGKGRQVCKGEIEKRDFKNLTCQEALVHVAKMLMLAHEEFKEKKFEYEISWITNDNGRQHQLVPNELRVSKNNYQLFMQNKAVAEAEKIIEQEAAK